MEVQINECLEIFLRKTKRSLIRAKLTPCEVLTIHEALYVRYQLFQKSEDISEEHRRVGLEMIGELLSEFTDMIKALDPEFAILLDQKLENNAKQNN